MAENPLAAKCPMRSVRLRALLDSAKCTLDDDTDRASTPKNSDRLVEGRQPVSYGKPVLLVTTGIHRFCCHFPPVLPAYP